MTSLPIRRLLLAAGLAAAFAARAAKPFPGANTVSAISGVIEQVQASGSGWIVTIDGHTYTVPQSALAASNMTLQPGQSVRLMFAPGPAADGGQTPAVIGVAPATTAVNIH